MGKLWSLGLLLLTAGTVFAQNIKVSERISMHNDENIEIIGQIGEQLIILRDRPDNTELIGYNAEMIKQYSKKIKLETRRPRLQKFLTKKDHFTLVYKYIKRNNIHLIAHKYDEQSDLIDSATINIIELKGTTTFSKEIVVSRNKRYLLIHDTDQNSRVYAMVYDLEEMKLIWNKTFRPALVDYEKDFLEALIDNQGNAYFVFEKDNRRSKNIDSRFEIFQYNFEQNQPKQYPISMQGRLWFDIDFVIDDLNNKLLASGMFTDNRFGEANGTFYLKIDPNQPDNSAATFHPFDAKFVMSVIGKEIKKNEGFGEVDIQDLVLRSDGGVLLIAERNRMYSRRAYTYNNYDALNQNGAYRNDYYYNDIILFSIGPTGEIQWVEILRKRQFSQDDSGIYSSFFLMKGKRNLRFLYNDEIKYDTNVYEYVVSGTGSYDRNNVLNTDKDNLSLRFKEGIQIASNTVIIPSVRRGDLKLVRMSF